MRCLTHSRLSCRALGDSGSGCEADGAGLAAVGGAASLHLLGRQHLAGGAVNDASLTPACSARAALNI